MANSHETLTGLFADIAGAIRSKTGGTGAIVADQFPDAIAAIDTQENLDAELSTQDSLIAQIAAAVEGKAGVALPVLSNPAGAGNIEAGYQAIDGAGRLIEGTAKTLKSVTISVKVLYGYAYEQFFYYVSGGEYKTFTLAANKYTASITADENSVIYFRSKTKHYVSKNDDNAVEVIEENRISNQTYSAYVAKNSGYIEFSEG